MTLKSTIIDYLAEFQDTYHNAIEGGAQSVELACRPLAHSFLERIIAHIGLTDDIDAVVRHEARIYGTPNTPDWSIVDRSTFGVFCYGDHKNLARSGPFTLTGPDKEQIERYLLMNRPLFVFDGLEFLFYNETLDNPTRHSLISKPVSLDSDWTDREVSLEAVYKLPALLKEPGYCMWTESQLVETLATRARFISDTLLGLLRRPRGSGEVLADNALIDALHDLKELLEDHHDPTLRNETICGDFIAQVLTFGLFFAHTQSPRVGQTPQERRHEISTYWNTQFLIDARRLAPFSAIFESLEAELGMGDERLTTGNDLAYWYRDLSGLLAHAEYMGGDDGPTDYHVLFERFLTSFDSQQRFDRGAFYTPTVLTDWTVRMADTLIRQHFDDDLLRLADRIIDPCCGTGSFLETIVDGAYGIADDVPMLIGFEILPAPYALAQYRMARAIDGTPFENRVQLFLTDTLSDRLQDPHLSGTNAFSYEVVTAAEHARPPLRVVIGNPPSSIRVVSEAPRTNIANIMNDLLPPPNKRSGRNNTLQAISNESYRFLRWSAARVLESGYGLLALVLPEPFIRSISFSTAREWLLKHFQDVWILNLDADGRGGGTTSSLFNVLQGRCVLFAVLNPTQSADGVTEVEAEEDTDREVRLVHYCDISGLPKPDKVAFLKKAVDVQQFDRVPASEPEFLFTPSNTYPRRLWDNCWPLHRSGNHEGIFQFHCSAIKLAPTSLLFHTDRQQLMARGMAISPDQPTDLDRWKEDWFKGQRRPPRLAKLTDEVKLALHNALCRSTVSIVEYSFRPFNEGHAVLDEEVFRALASTDGGGTRARPELLAAYGHGAVGIAVVPATEDVDEEMSRFVTFAWHLPDNDLAARGSARVYCNIYPSEGAEHDSIAGNATADIAKFFNWAPDPHEAVLYYTYAIMNSDAYLDTFEGALYRSGNPDVPPRVPIVADIEERQKIADLGRRIAHQEATTTLAPEIEQLDIKWPDDVGEFRLDKEGKQNLYSSNGTIVLTGTEGETASITGVPEGVIDLRVAGHNVLKKWIRERTFPYLRRTFRYEDACDLKSLIQRISAQLDLLGEINLILDPVLAEGEGSLLGPPRVNDKMNQLDLTDHW